MARRGKVLRLFRQSCEIRASGSSFDPETVEEALVGATPSPSNSDTSCAPE
jgi:hypothetical protein